MAGTRSTLTAALSPPLWLSATSTIQPRSVVDADPGNSVLSLPEGPGMEAGASAPPTHRLHRLCPTPLVLISSLSEIRRGLPRRLC